MAITDSDHQVRVQIETAAQGCISGTLSEWPHLKSALRKLGYDLPDCSSADTVKHLCQKILSDRGIKY